MGTLHQLKLLSERCHGFGGPPLTSGCENTHGSRDFAAASVPSGTCAASLRWARPSGWAHAATSGSGNEIEAFWE